MYVNWPLSSSELDPKGEPVVRYVRNKVRTSKYTVVTFVPKNLYEQFRRVANIYFLFLVILQIFPVFGAANGSISFVPLVFILAVTAIKDGIEDYRRASLDEEVNTSAATKLGNWRNVNQPTDPRAWFEKLLGLNPPGKVTKGVQKLREKDANEGKRIILRRSVDNSIRTVGSLEEDPSRRLEDIQSIDSHTYPPGLGDSAASLGASAANLAGGDWGQKNYPDSMASQTTIAASTVAPGSDTGVIDWRRRATGMTRWERTLWKKLEVGDIVLLRDNEQVPADVVILSTADPEGMCYVETKNLDGETNLKPRRAVRSTSDITAEEDVERAAFYLDSEPPHQNLYLYHGILRWKDSHNTEKAEPVSINELLLRGCTIRNTQWIIGLVVFTGADTKIMLNGGDTPSKQSKIEKETNFNVIINFVILIGMCTIAAILYGVEEGEEGTSAQFYEIDTAYTDSIALESIIIFVACLIAFQNIVPISLYISIEVVKTVQAYFISQDTDMYYEPYDTACVAKTWNISDDLGQIEYIFSDKTGTLTQNIMEFQKCSINGVSYGEGITEAQKGAATREGKDSLSPEEMKEKLAVLKQDMISKMDRAFKNRYLQKDKLTLISPKLAEDLVNRNSQQRTSIIAFFRALALCHSVLSDKPDPQKDPYRLEYKAESPDESALVAAARDVGFPFVNKGKDFVDIEVMGQVERYTPLRMLEFNSTRKRMSVIMRCPDGRLILYCKGADSVIYERLAKDHDQTLKEQTSKDMELFANNGLRTLCIAYRYLEEDEYFEWSRTYDAAANSINDRDEEIDKANALIEHSLIILGATALEDKLQEGVPEAIETLHQAGIKLWILTGDKLQTAIEIGYSCNLLKHEMDLMILSADSLENARSQIEAGLNKIASVLGPPSWDPRKRGFVPGQQASFAVVIDGDTLRHALTDELKPLFLNLGTQCETVVCCRVSPAQKALTVKLVKDGRKAMTLSIGDGANDVAMIQEANIGCGLLGLEGSQAAMSADYAFGQFRFLTKLLLVHGRWSYQRISDMHSNFFYKNVTWTFGLFWFLPFTSFDATYLYQYTFILLCNVVFTSLPVSALGAFDQDIHAKAALAFPQLYVRGIRGLEYTKPKFWYYMFDGLYQSVVVFFVPYLVWSLGLAISWNGKGIDSLSDFGTTVAVSAIFAANLYVGVNTNYWTILTWIVVWGSSIVMLLWIVIYSFFETVDFIDEVVILFGNVTFWATVIIAVFICLVPRVFIKFINTSYRPLDKDIVREMWVMGDLKDRLGIKHRKRKNHSIAAADVEHAPMFHEPHARSMSDVSLNHPYEHLDVESPPTSSPLGGPTSPKDSPRPSGLGGPNQLEVQYLYAPATRQPINSPHGSYYSASEIPAPSPLPEPVYRYPSGEVTSNPPSRRASGRQAQEPQTYEMTSLSPGMMSGHSHQRSVTDASYTTAADDYYSAAPSPNYVAGQEHLSVNDRDGRPVSWQGGRAL